MFMIKFFFDLGILGCLLLVGCASPSNNPSSPQAKTGYVDFYTDSDMNLSWEVKRADEDNGTMRTVFSDYKPIEGNTLRVATSPGSHRFQVWFTNQATEGPEQLQVQVEDGKVTPVHIALTPGSSATVDRKVYGFRPSAKGYGRGTKIKSDPIAIYKIEAAAQSSAVYQPKERMPYFVLGESK
jgi:hypothetical protein